MLIQLYKLMLRNIGKESFTNFYRKIIIMFFLSRQKNHALQLQQWFPSPLNFQFRTSYLLCIGTFKCQEV